MKQNMIKDRESMLSQDFQQQVSICELLDRVLNKGVVLTGEITISVAGVELVYIGLNVLISSVQTLLDAQGDRYEVS